MLQLVTRPRLRGGATRRPRKLPAQPRKRRARGAYEQPGERPLARASDAKPRGKGGLRGGGNDPQVSPENGYPMDPLALKLEAVDWRYGDKDPAAARELEHRIASSARGKGFITYSELVRDVTFHLPSVAGGRPYQIRTSEWSGLDRKIIGEFLGYVSARSYVAAGFLATAVVVSSSELKPSELFFSWMQELGALPDLKEDTVLAFWARHFNEALKWYKTNPSRTIL